MRRVFLIAALVAIMVSCSKVQRYDTVDQMVNQASKQVSYITPQQLHQWMQDYEPYTLIDVRQELEHYHGFIPGSVNIARGSLEFNIADPKFWEQTGLYEPAKDDRIILYCLKGQRSSLAAVALKQLGYNNVFVIEGGYKKWELTYPDIFEKALDKLSGQSEKPAKSGSC